MDINENNIKFVFYLDGNKYIVFSLTEDISFGDDLYFAKEIKNAGYYDCLDEKEYEKVLNEYKEYLVSTREDEEYEN